MLSSKENELKANRRNSILLYIEAALTTAKGEQPTLLGMIKQWQPKTLQDFVASNNKLRQFCESNKELNQSWADTLKKQEIFSGPIISMDGKVALSTLDLFLSNNIMQDFAKIKRSAADNKNQVILMNQACELNDYYGLVLRCKFTITVLAENPNLDSERRDHYVKQIEDAADKLSNIYWGLGYIRAGFARLKLANYFLTREDPGDKKRGQAYFEAGIRDFLCAAQLKSNELSNSIMDGFLQGKPVSSISKDASMLDFTDWVKAKTKMQEWVGPHTYMVLEDRAEKKVQNELKSETNNSSKPV